MSINAKEDQLHAYGHVVNIRSIPSRGVTRIEIEIPVESHKDATALLFEQDAVILPWSHVKDAGVPYGVRKLSDYTTARERQPERQVTHTRSGFGSLPRTRDLVQEAALLCKDSSFWRVLERHAGNRIHDEHEAADTLRALLEVPTRADLKDNTRAQDAFNHLVSEHNALRSVEHHG